MRKADYATLAALIREQYESATQSWHAKNGGQTDKIILGERARVCKRIALAFADAASVDRAAFLKACGIDPS